ncbi:copper resistance protein B [Acinetobacter sp. ANC 4558]|uniref:copper resistance protein B n=1 Tax=Acinetobacter sp. ANC 4558 TaxID=1977876 RepID=UPI00148AB493|nr:copper resistance protein B [Acinetobacter sp. ANC 4558]
MNITNIMSVRFLSASLLLSGVATYTQANENNHRTHSNDNAFKNSVPYDPPSVHDDHASEHGGQIHLSTEVETKWVKDDGDGKFQNQLEVWLGTDENKLFLQLNTDKKESEKTEFDTKLMYSRAFKEFWDLQTGIRHRYYPEREVDKNQTYFSVGLNGLAPYFFDTDIYLYAGKDKQYLMSIETDRDFLLTQKLIFQPYLHTEIIFNDDSKYAKKSGLHEMSVGAKTRYEITKQVMPFIEVGYKYEHGDKQTAWQESESSSHGWIYGAGVQFLF